MSIASEISRLHTAKADLKTSIENKGVTVPSATKLDGYASLVDQIQTGQVYKSVLIIYIETGSTVGIYDSTYTTLIQQATEHSPGEYWITGLNNATYYIKATKGVDEATTSYTITQFGVYRISMDYVPEQVINYTMLYDGSLGNATANQCSNLTGGWASTGYTVNSSYWSLNDLTLAATNMNGTTANSKLYIRGMQTPVDASNYVGLFLNTLPTSASNICGYFHNTNRFKFTYANRTQIPSSSVKTITYEDISGVTRSSFVVLACVGKDNAAGNTAYFYNIGILKADDTATLATALSLSNNTTDTILASSSDIDILLGSERAVKWMCALCTGDFMTKAIANSTFMTAYASSAYKTIINANEHWAKFLAMVA